MTARQINNEVKKPGFNIYINENKDRIVRARQRKGVLEGKILNTGKWVCILSVQHD